MVDQMLGLAHLKVTQLYTGVAEPLQLPPKQFVPRDPCISPKNIAEKTGPAPTVMVGILDSLSE